MKKRSYRTETNPFLLIYHFPSCFNIYHHQPYSAEASFIRCFLISFSFAQRNRNDANDFRMVKEPKPHQPSMMSWKAFIIRLDYVPSPYSNLYKLNFFGSLENVLFYVVFRPGYNALIRGPCMNNNKKWEIHQSVMRFHSSDGCSISCMIRLTVWLCFHGLVA